MITCKICERETFCDSLPYHSKICKETHRLREELVNLRRKMDSFSEKASSLKHSLEIYAVHHKKLKKRKKFCKWNSIDGLCRSPTEQLPITSPNSNPEVYHETLLQKISSTPNVDCNGHSSGGWSDRNSNADTACTQGDPGENELQSKESVCYEEIKEDVQKSIFALKRAKAIAEKIHGWGFDTHSMNDLDFNFRYELKVLLEDIKDPKISEFLHSLTNDCYRYLELKAKYIKKKEKLSTIDLQQENMPPEICKKKPLGPTVKPSLFKPRFPVTSRSRKFREDDLINIDGKIRERTSPTPKRSPGKRSPVPSTRILQDIKSPNKLTNRNNFQAIFNANNGVNTPPPLNFAKVFPKHDTPELHPQHSSGSSVSSSGQKDSSGGSLGTPLSSSRFGPLNTMNLLQTNYNHITPNLSSFGQQTKRMANDKMSCKEKINFLISAFPKDFNTSATNTSAEKSLTFEKSTELDSKNGSIPSLEWVMNPKGNVLTARIPTLLNTETSIFEDSTEKTKIDKRYDEVRRREIRQKKTRSRSMHNLRAIHLEEIRGKKDFPSLIEPTNKGKTNEQNSKQSSQSSKRFGSGMLGSARGMIESPVLKGYQSDTTTKKSGVRFMRE